MEELCFWKHIYQQKAERNDDKRYLYSQNTALQPNTNKKWKEKTLYNKNVIDFSQLKAIHRP